MKKIFKTSVLCAFSALLLACAKDPSVPVEGGKVRLHLSATVPDPLPSTRAFGQTGSLSSIKLVVFDASGAFIEAADAESLSVSGGTASFDVTLTATSDPVRVHFVANHDTGSLPFGIESELIGGMYTTGGDEAYWQSVSLPDGIPADGGTPAALTGVALVRNFCGVRVVCSDPDFTLKGFALTNVPDRGSVAPYMGTGFAPYGGTSAPNYASLSAAGYHGYTPAGAVLQSTGAASLTFSTGTFYMYEHPYTGDKDTYTSVVVWGRKAGYDADSYYKVDIVKKNADGTTEYYDLLRNILYTLTLAEVSGIGHPSAAAALASPAGNNISGSVDTDDLRNISDGNGQLFVSETSLVFASGDPMTLRYMWVPDITRPSVTSNDSVTLDAPAGSVLSTPGVKASSDASGWRTVTLTPNTPGAVISEQTITLTTNTGLQKRIKLILRPKYTLPLTLSPTTVPSVIGSPVEVRFTIPDGFPMSLFPLDFIISSDANTIYPDSEYETMPVSINTPRYGFLRTVTYTEYSLNNIPGTGCTIVCYMLTNATASATTVRVNEYFFNEASKAFSN